MPDRCRLAVQGRRPQTRSGKVQGDRLEILFKHVEREIAHPADSFLLAGGRVVGGHQDRALRSVGLRRLLGLLQQIFVFRSGKQHAVGLVFQQHVEVRKWHEDLAHRDFGLVRTGYSLCELPASRQGRSQECGRKEDLGCWAEGPWFTQPIRASPSLFYTSRVQTPAGLPGR